MLRAFGRAHLSLSSIARGGAAATASVRNALPWTRQAGSLFSSESNKRDSSPSPVFHAHNEIARTAHVQHIDDYHARYDRSINSQDEFWAEEAMRHIRWQQEFQETRTGDFSKGDVAWFINGKLNAAVNCVDRHAAEHPEQVAIIYEADEPDQGYSLTYEQLLEKVCRFANALRTVGAKKGDTITIFMPTIPEAAIAMLACARLGCVHSIVFAGFSPASLRQRIEDSKSRFVVTVNEGRRGGKSLPLKQIVDTAIDGLEHVETVFVHKHTSANVPMKEGRDLSMEEAMKAENPYCPPRIVDSEHPLFVLYTSGSTGKPKGLIHTTGGYLVAAATSHHYVFDYHKGDIHACVADVGWITGHTYIVYGPLANGATTLMFESMPTYPSYSRYWEMIEKHKVNSFYTSPTAVRELMKHGDSHVEKHDLSSLRVIGTVGEPIDERSWLWLYEVVGKKKCSIVDTYWQTETGAIAVAPLPGATPTKPGSATLPFFGIKHAVFDPVTRTQVLPKENERVHGDLCFAQPWPGIARTILGDHERYIKTYFEPYPGHYYTGDKCHLDEDGYLWITGRADDVINKAGHRISGIEVENAIRSLHGCSEVAVVGLKDSLKGEIICAFCVQQGNLTEDSVKKQVRTLLGGFSTPDRVYFIPQLPNTRSGKIVRRLLRDLLEGNETGDTSTLSDPHVLEEIRTTIRGRE